MRRLLAAVALTLTTGPAAAESLVLSLSADTVMISSNFTGAGITVFGAVEDAVPGPVLSIYDLVVVMEGPPETAVARRKDSILGLWINRAAVTFANVPEFYALASSRSPELVTSPGVLQELGVGVDNLNLELAPGDNASAGVQAVFADAFRRLKRDEGHYDESSGSVTSPGAGLFRADFALPANVPDGTYTITAYLFRDGSLVAVEDAPLEIAKAGAEAFVFSASRNNSWLYALAIVAMAAATGWLGRVIFRRD